MKNWEKIKNLLKRSLRQKKSPNEIALGFAVGTFFCILPTPGLSIVIALGTLIFYPKMSKLAMIASFALWNPLVALPFYALGHRIGVIFFSDTEVVKFHFDVFNIAYDFTRRVLLGSLIVSSIMALVSYSLIRFVLYLKRRKALIN